MKIWTVFKKSMVENFRDWKILIFCLLFAPFFIMIMDLYFGGSIISYKLILVNQDQGSTRRGLPGLNAGAELVDILERQKNTIQGANVIIRQENSLDRALEKLKEKKVDGVIHIPPDFSRVVDDFNPREPSATVTVKTFGDPENFKYVMAAAYFDYLTSLYVAEKTKLKSPVTLQAVPVHKKEKISQFDKYIPALLILSVINLLFTAGGSIIREKDKSTIIRLRMSRMTTFEWMMGVTLSQILIGILAFILAALTAGSVGYHPSGSLLLAVIIVVLSSVSMVAVSLLVVAFMRSVFDLMTVGCLPYFVLMFFSGSMIPLPPLQLFTLDGRVVMVNEILPVTHSINALGRILNSRAGLGDIWYEIGALVFLSTLFFGLGIFLFTRRHMRY